MDNLKEMEQILAHAQAKNALIDEKQQLNSQVNKYISSNFKGLESDKDLVLEKIKQAPPSDEFKKMLIKNPELVNEYLVDEFGRPLELAISDQLTPERELEFRRDFLVYLRASQEYNDKIDEEFAKKEEAEKEFNKEISECIKLISDNFLMHVQQMEESINDPSLTPEQQKRRRKRLDAIKSGYTFQYFIELLDKHKGLKDNVKKDFNNPIRKSHIITTYAQKTKKAVVNPVLGVMLHNDQVSLERNFLTDDDYDVEGLMLFFMVRSFSMSGFEDLNRTLHSSLSLILSKMVKNDISDEFKAEVVENMRKLAAKLR